MDLIERIMAIIGGTLVPIFGWIVFRKPRSRIEHLNANGKDIEVANASLSTLRDVNIQLGEAHQLMGEMRANIARQDMAIIRLRNKIADLIKITQRQISLKEYAEQNICLVSNCDLRTPPKGKYKSNSDSVILDKISKDLEKEGDNDIS